ncbi:hypothetical protein GCM10010259_44740 [Streptomyces daghestanicus]|uniref:Thiopeptide-type bacteriocin biosynthesis domain-containing protein n=1 Tax=Streptomyces daghestanicus TaxID=66885 RepID=A0ABQ3PW64_9ACTN|nr:hypothetical protein GCM10010259_44740 [Streptomyces daghestanicus]GHI29254.1 hypothetical protein Sdagh_09840 [Streptomyces daghestanicus]
MARQWLFVRLYGAAGAATSLPPVLPRLARYLRSAAPGACFFFSRADGPAGPAVDAWVDCDPRARPEVVELLRARTGPPWRLAVRQDVRRTADQALESGRDVTDELAAVSTAFALAVLPEGAPDPEEAFRLGVTHLRDLVGLLPEDAGPGFLFQCWQLWSAALPPRRREELAVEADVRAATVPHPRSEARHAYLEGTRQVLRRGPAGGLPEPYLLLHHAGATHDRLGIPPAWGAAAALTVRNELTARPARLPATASGGRI